MNAPAAVNALDWLTVLLVLCSAYCLPRCTVGYLWGYSSVHSRSHHFRFSSAFFLTFYTADFFFFEFVALNVVRPIMKRLCSQHALRCCDVIHLRSKPPSCTHRMCWAQNDTSCDTAWWGFHTNVTCRNAHLGVTRWRYTAVTPLSPFDNSSRRDNILWPNPCFYIT